MASSDNSNSFAKTLDFDDTARKFYKALSALQRQSNSTVTDRTPQQLDKRHRNNEAARVSRAKSRMAEAVMQKQAAELEAANTSIKKTIASQ